MNKQGSKETGREAAVVMDPDEKDADTRGNEKRMVAAKQADVGKSID